MKKWRLVYESDGHPARVGDKVKTFRGVEGRLMDFRPPRHVGSSGRVYVLLDSNEGASVYPREVLEFVELFHGTIDPDYRSEFFPGVIGARFVEVDEPGED